MLHQFLSEVTGNSFVLTVLTLLVCGVGFGLLVALLLLNDPKNLDQMARMPLDNGDEI